MSEWISSSLRRQVIETASQKDPFECPYCHFKFIFGVEDPNINVDHIVPRTRGGLTVLKNLQVICRSCNKSKWYHRDVPKPDRKMISRVVRCSCGSRIYMTDFDYHVNIELVRTNSILCDPCNLEDIDETSDEHLDEPEEKGLDDRFTPVTSSFRKTGIP